MDEGLQRGFARRPRQGTYAARHARARFDSARQRPARTHGDLPAAANSRAPPQLPVPTGSD